MLTHRERVLKRLKLPLNYSPSVNELSILTGIPEPILNEVGRRGAGAWKTNISSVRLRKDFSKNPNTVLYPRSARLSQSQWSSARIWSFIDRGKTFYTADRDLAKKAGLL